MQIATPTEDNNLQFLRRNGCFDMYGQEPYRDHVLAVGNALEAGYRRVCDLLELDYRDTVRVEIYRDQSHFDQYVMDTGLKGFYACSGNHTIQIVSPANPPKQVEITYEERAEIAVHEFVHLVLDAIQPAAPIWIDEGTACFVGSYLGYAAFCQQHFPFDLRPSFLKLTEDYYAVPGNDLFSFTMVDYLVTTYGWGIFNQLLRRPEALETILDIEKSVIEEQWQAFMTHQYANPKSAQPFIAIRSMPTARLAHRLASVNGKVYAIGGGIVQNKTVLSFGIVEEYDPLTNQWTAKRSMPTPRSSFGLAVVHGKIYIIGGTPTDSREALDTMEVYDPQQDRWASLANMPTPRSQVGVGIIEGKIYAVGGNAGHEHTFEVYDPDLDTWKKLPDLPTPWRNAGVATAQGRLFVAGGVAPDGWTTVSTIQEYVPHTGEWKARENMLLSRTDFAFCTYGGKLYALGGFHDGPITDVEAYDPISNRWTRLEPLPTPLQFHSAAVLQGEIAIIGGTTALPAATNAAFIYHDRMDPQNTP